MEYGAIDLHKRESQIRIEEGAIVDRRIATTRERLTSVSGVGRACAFCSRRRPRVSVAQHLETLGHEVILADPNFTAMYGHRSRRIKTDRRDVAAVAEACQQGCYRVAHRRSALRRTVQAQLNIRRELTEARTRAISLTRALVRGAGFRIRSGSTDSFLTRVVALDLPPL